MIWGVFQQNVERNQETGKDVTRGVGVSQPAGEWPRRAPSCRWHGHFWSQHRTHTGTPSRLGSAGAGLPWPPVASRRRHSDGYVIDRETHTQRGEVRTWTQTAGCGLLAEGHQVSHLGTKHKRRWCTAEGRKLNTPHFNPRDGGLWNQGVRTRKPSSDSSQLLGVAKSLQCLEPPSSPGWTQGPPPTPRPMAGLHRAQGPSVMLMTEHILVKSPLLGISSIYSTTEVPWLRRV